MIPGRPEPSRCGLGLSSKQSGWYNKSEIMFVVKKNHLSILFRYILNVRRHDFAHLSYLLQMTLFLVMWRITAIWADVSYFLDLKASGSKVKVISTWIWNGLTHEMKLFPYTWVSGNEKLTFWLIWIHSLIYGSQIIWNQHFSIGSQIIWNQHFSITLLVIYYQHHFLVR